MKIDNYNIIDFGLSKIRFSVFDKNLVEKFSETKDVKINENYDNHFHSIIEIIKKAEKKISSHIKDVILITDTSKLFTIDISLNKYLEKKITIKKAYHSMVLELEQLISNNYNEYHIVHIILDKCLINDNTFAKLPKNIYVLGNIKLDFKVICFPKKLILNLKNKFIQNNLNVLNIYCTSYVKSLLYNSQIENKKVTFLEIGWERSSLVYYEKDKLKFINSIAIGGFHITKDISKIFNISIEDAEKIKKSFNKSETEFSYETNNKSDVATAKDILKKKISINLLKKVILYRVQEIIDLSFKQLNKQVYKYSFKNSELFLIGDGSILFNDNSFYLDNGFGFKSINFFQENDTQICKSGLIHYFNNYQTPEIRAKKQGLFEKFFNFFAN